MDNTGHLDWASVGQTSQTDPYVGSGDNSFGQGTKEDTSVPTVVAGGIPPNKSDLKQFGTYLETTSGDDFLHMYWTRVQDPTGTTNMDFEFNQSGDTSINTVTPVRTAGDLLIQYDLANGGTVPQLFLSRWRTVASDGPCEASSKYPCWGVRANLGGDATGSINSSEISSGELSPLGPRTFGEASVNFSAITGGGCNPFGSAYLKSRSSDSFSAALKDFIAPVSTSFNACQKVTITKTDDSTPTAALLSGATFSVYEDLTPQSTTAPGAEDVGTVAVPVTPVTSCTTDNTGTCSTSEVLDPAKNYWVVETTTPSGYATAPPQRIVLPTVDVTLTFVNPRQFKVIVLVCKKADNSLYSSNVTLPSGSSTPADTKKSLASSTSPTAADLCGLGGAAFGDLPTGIKSVSVNIGQTPVP